MNFKISNQKPEVATTSLVVVSTETETIATGSPLARLDSAMKGQLGKILKQEGFKGKAPEQKLIHTQGQLSADAILVVGRAFEIKGDLPANNLEILRRAASGAARLANARQYKTMCFDLSGWDPGDFKESDLVQATVEGMELGSYRFDTYRNKKDIKKNSLTTVHLTGISSRNSNQSAIERGLAISEGTLLARDLVNAPANDMNPQTLAKEAKKVGPNIQCKVYSKAEITKLKMGSYLSVSAGSEVPPALIHMVYKPKGKSKKTVAVVGKGVTFDSGGLSLKPSGSMETMKDDMAGSAAAIGLMQTLARIQPKVTVHVVVAATENMPSGAATKPGDVVTAMNGKTIEILNTDAEGRLTLADALHFIIQKGPDVVIDMATLTGACLVALGERISGLMGNDDKLLDDLIEASEYSGEMLWQLPLLEEYRADLKSPIADLKNIGGRWGGTITAGLFLQEFVGKARWAHLDIAGPSWSDKQLPYISRGGTGCMVSTLTQYILHL